MSKKEIINETLAVKEASRESETREEESITKQISYDEWKEFKDNQENAPNEAQVKEDAKLYETREKFTT